MTEWWTYKGANYVNLKRIWIHVIIKQLCWTTKIWSYPASYPLSKFGWGLIWRYGWISAGAVYIWYLMQLWFLVESMWQIALSRCWCWQWPGTGHEAVCQESWWCLVQGDSGWHCQSSSVTVRGSLPYFLTCGWRRYMFGLSVCLCAYIRAC